jgi:conjugal transfer pilus assembly protein TraK
MAGADVRQAGGSTYSGVPQFVMGGIQQNPPKNGADLKPEQLSYVIKPGAVLTTDVSRNFLNRIVTPFDHPVVKSLSKTVSVEIVGRALFVSVDPAQAEPVVLYIMNKGDDLDSVSLMLNAKDVGPVQIDLQLPGQIGVGEAAYKFDDNKASQWEQSAPYTQTLTDVMRQLAQRKVPPGYAFRDYGSGDHMPTCQQAGLRVVPKQVMEGHDMVAFVGVLSNESQAPIELQETTCAVKGVLAVASWPGPLIQPHQSSEIYIVVKRSDMPGFDGVRPSALVQGGAP